MNQTKGTDLVQADRDHVLRSYIHRFTGDNIPAWAKQPRPDSTPYPVQFRDDREWLENTKFNTCKDGRLDRRADHCESSPTWPNGRF